MQSQKVTSEVLARPRWYADACGAAHGLELLGERWSLLVVRELMFGPRRFGAIRSGLPGISAKVLTERLEGLQHAGIVVRRMLPAPASAFAYELTPWGREAEPIFGVLGRWAARSPTHDTSLPLSAASLMLSFRAMYSPERAADLALTLGFRFDEDAFRVSIDACGLRIVRAEPERVDVLIASTPPMVAAVVYGGLPLEQAEASGAVRVEGDRALLARFAALFPLPSKATTPLVAGG